MNHPQYYDPAPSENRSVEADLCVYGGVSGGVIAAVEAARRGLNVVLLEPGAHLGGMTAGGLGMTDIGNKHVIGGLAREFYQRVGRHYGSQEAEWNFEPHVAEAVFEDMVEETGVQVFRQQFVDSVINESGRIVSLRTVSGLTVEARVFIDATYEGDLMARAGVSYTVGRESNTKYDETANGQQILNKHQFMSFVDPYVVPGTPGSGVLPGIEPDGVYQQGQGDQRVQAYNFRMCLTHRPEIRTAFPKPAAYDADWYILLKRFLATGWNEAFDKFDAIRNGKPTRITTVRFPRILSE